MKKLTVLSLSLLTTISVITSCKKGEHDPTLSLLSRKSRLAGSWVVHSREVREEENFVDSTLNTKTLLYDKFTYQKVKETTFNGSVENGTKTTIKKEKSVVTALEPVKYSETYVFERDGSFTHTVIEKLSTVTQNGTWIFMKKNKDLSLKNKEAIVLNVHEEIVKFGNVTSQSSQTGFNSSVIVLDELKRNEIILFEDYSDQFKTDLMTLTGELFNTYHKKTTLTK